jgi:hypothetical protein
MESRDLWDKVVQQWDNMLYEAVERAKITVEGIRIIK